MNYKYTITKDDSKKELIIDEYSILDKMDYSLTFKKVFPDQMVIDALKGGRIQMITTLRSGDFFPNLQCMVKIIEVIINLYSPKESNPDMSGQSDSDGMSVDVFYDDGDEIRRPGEPYDEDKNKVVKFDDLLSDDDEDLFSDEEDLDGFDSVDSSDSSSIQIADDDSVDFEDDESI